MELRLQYSSQTDRYDVVSIRDEVVWPKVTPAVDHVARERKITDKLVRDLQQIFYDIDREFIRIRLGLADG